ncbi:TetR/AcrR family transcriptional regulator [Diaphorobacter ruginosibacter]|uniref:TetR/AcrR family transcriptional regulator n=1 Tax=Diaphorobacter ruginosibacter TaxID=1715720 RepID=UPI00333E6E1F
MQSTAPRRSVDATPKTIVQRRKSKATREALLEAARVVIARDGYTNARIVDIAREAGKSAGVFYSYFEDKTQLFSALVDAFYEDVKRVTPTLKEYEDNPAEAVKASINAFWHAYRHFHPEMVGLLESALSDPALLEVWRNIRQRGIRRFAYRIKKQQANGKCVGMDPELSATALQGLLEFTCFNWHSKKLDFPGKRIDDAKATRELYQIISRVLEL